MFERLTDRARKVAAFANEEARRFKHECTGPAHILLGVVREGSGVGAAVLKNYDVSIEKLRAEVEKLAEPGSAAVTPGSLPLTPGGKKIFEYALEEARSLNHNYVGTEHLLLGLIREGEGTAVQVLRNIGLKLEDMRQDILGLMGGRDSYETFSDRARKVMVLANQEAQRFRHKYIGTEHILLGLAKVESGIGATVLQKSGVNMGMLRIQVERLAKSGSEAVRMGRLPQTPRAKKVIEYAIEEAAALKHSHVGTEHLLLGLIREDGGIAAHILMHLRLTYDDVRQEVLKLLREER